MRDETEQLGARDGSDVRRPSPAPRPLKAGEDFYTEGAAVVFTARYHLRRGYCCGNGCRHCPYAEGAGAALMNHEKSAVGKQSE